MDMVTLKGLQSDHVKNKINKFKNKIVILWYLDMSPISWPLI